MCRSCSRSGRRCCPECSVPVIGCPPSRKSSPISRSTRTRCSRPTASSRERDWSRDGRASAPLPRVVPTARHRRRRPRSTRSLATWVAKARTAGLDDEAMETLLRATIRAHGEQAQRVNATPSSGLAMVTDPSRDDSAVLRAAGLGKRYGSRWALEGCTIAIPRGRICGLVGANGAGKTTLLKLLVGLTRPSAGTVEVLGRAPAFEPAFLRLIGYLAQDVPLYRRWSVADHLTMGERDEPGVGRPARPGPPGCPGDPARTEGRHAVRRSAGAGRAGSRVGQATASARARRASGRAGSASPARIPQHVDRPRSPKPITT